MPETARISRRIARTRRKRSLSPVPGLIGRALAGLGLVVLGLVVPGDVRGQESPDDPVADSLVSVWIDALGGMKPYHERESARFTLTTELYDTVRSRLKRTRPRYVTIARLPTGEASRIERWEGDDFIVQGFDGADSIWAVMNGEALGPGDKDYDEALYVARDVWYWQSLPYKLRDPGVFLHYGGRTEEGLHEVSVSFGQGVGEHDDSWFYYFRDGRAWPVEVHYIEEGKTTLNTTRWAGFRSTESGWVYPEHRIHFDEQGRVFKVIRLHDVVIDPEVGPQLFRRP